MSDGSQRRDFLHVADAGAALAALAGSQVTGAINIASGEDVALCDVGERLARLAGGPELLDLGALDRREDDPPSIVADVGRLRDELGWQPRIGLDDGLRETFQWWRERTDHPS
jgi:nucleoside-diphosphate-sugar epimerase